MKQKSFCDLYYILVVLAYISTVFLGFVRPGVFATILMLGVVIELIYKKHLNIRSVMDVLIVVYFLYRVLSIIQICLSGMSAGVYTGELAVSVLPMIFYFVGRSKTGYPDGFYRMFIYALLVLGFVSLVFYITAPQFYLNYLYDWSYISKADASTMRVRMQSVVGCTVFGSIMALGMSSSVFFLCSDNAAVSDLEDNKHKSYRIFGAVGVIATMVFAVLSNQRAAMATVIILIVYINYIVFVKFDNIPKKYALYEVGGIIALMAVLCAVRFDFVLKVWWRLSSLPGAVSQRSEQWVAAVNNMFSFWFGNGIGANGHKALGIEGAHVIADGGLIKLYCEEGIIGFSFFLYILFLTFSKGIKNIQKYYAEIGTVAVAILLSIGSNVLAFQMATPIFWFAIGRIWEKPSDDELVSVKRHLQKDSY